MSELSHEAFAELSEGNDNLDELSESQKKLIEEFENAELEEEWNKCGKKLLN